MRVLIVEDGPYLAEAIRDGPRPEAIADDIAARIVASDSGMPILMITAAVGHRIDTDHGGADRG